MSSDTINLFVSSTAPGVDLDSNGTRLRVNLNSPLIVPKKRKCRVLSSNVWYDFPNIISPNNTIQFTYNSIVRTHTIPTGLYSLHDLKETIKELEVNLGLPQPFFELQADEATGKISFRVTNLGGLPFAMNYESNNYIFKNLLGFTGTHSGTGDWYEGTNKAQLNQVNSVLLHSSFSNSGYFNGNSGSSVIAEVQITTTPGSQLITKDLHPIVSNVTETQIDSYVIWMTSEDGRTPLTSSEPWSLIIELY